MKPNNAMNLKKLLPMAVGVMLAPLAAMAAPLPDGGPYTETVDGIEWSFYVTDGEAEVSGANPVAGSIAIPSILGDCPATGIRTSAFNGCNGLKAVTIPGGVANIGYYAFFRCSGLEVVTIAEGVKSIGYHAFSHCSELTTVMIPASVTNIENYAFLGCNGITSITIPDRFVFLDLHADNGEDLTNATILVAGGKIRDRMFEGCHSLMSLTISDGIAEIGESAFENCRRVESVTIPATVKKIDAFAFYGCGRLRTVTYLGEKPEVGVAAFGETGIMQSLSCNTINVVTTNVVVQYVLNSVQSNLAAPVSTDTGFVNVITEVVSGGAVSVPSAWSANYSGYEAKFGTDFTKSLAKKTGKKDGAGNPMLVWQDFVAGTDPTDENDVFKASVTMVGGKPVVSYTPRLSDTEKAKRKYTTWGKVKLQDEKWVEVPSGSEDDYNFFKVTVEMR